MFALLAFSLALLPSSFAALVAPSPAVAVSNPIITPGPSEAELRKRQNAADYMGVVLWSGTWSSVTCEAGHTYYQSAGQWGCCSTGKAGCLNNIAINCLGNGTMIFRASTGTLPLSNSLVTIPCSSIWTDATDRSFTVCNTAYMYENDRDSNPKLNVVCGVSSLNWSYYRAQPAAPGPSTTPARGPSIPAGPSPTPASPTPPGIPTPISTPSEEKSKSKAWIAGAVVGPLLGLALIGLGLFFFMRRKKNKTNNHHVAPASGSVAAPGASAYQQNTYNGNPGSPQPPQYYPNMQQTGAAGPIGTGKPDGYYNPGPQTPISPQGSQGPYGAAPQTWQHGAQPVYGAPSPSVSPQPQNVQPAQYNAPRHFSSELDAGVGHGHPDVVSVQPKR